MSLTGKRIVNTRAVHQAAEFDALLRAQGAVPLAYPCIAIMPMEDSYELDQALQSKFDMLVLTSANSVRMLAQRLHALGGSLRGMRAAAVGAPTAQAAQDQLGVEVRVIPADHSAHALAEALAIRSGERLLLPQSEIARPTLAESLKARGVNVTAVTAYRTVRASGGVELTPLLRDRLVDVVTFTSSSTARYFVERLHDEGGGTLDGVCIASVGSQTSRTAREYGLTVTVEAEKHTLDGLIDALAAHFHP